MTPVVSLADRAGPDSTFTILAEDQPEYMPLPALVFQDGKVLTEWTLTDEERSAIWRGENIRLWVWTFGETMQPVALEVTSEEKD